jgi:hypothetical protein
MANITPFNPNNPPSLPTPGNVASLANPSTLSNLKNSISPTTFGDQVKSTAKQQIIKAATNSTITKLYKEKADLIQEGIQLDINHQKTLVEIELKHTPKKQVQNGQIVDIPAEYDDQQYHQAINAENKNYDEAKKNLQERKDANQKSIDDFLKDPFKKQKDEFKKIKDRLKKRKTNIKKNQKKSRNALTKSILKNAKKSLVPILALTLTNQIANIVAQNDRIGKLVDDTNAIIIDANESGDNTKLQNAKVARDNAIKIINDNEDKIRKVKQQIDRISRIISIFSIIVTIISSIPIPTAVPPGIGIPVNLIMKFVKILDKANRILLALSALLPILLSVLDKAIAILEDYKSQLLDINGALDKASTDNFELLSGPGGLNTTPDFGTTNETYKGFRFAIREDNSFGGVHVGKFKRHYAVAIDINNVDILKSEYSFTLDPNDLIDQLKLVIDQQGLFTGDGNSSLNGNSNNPNNTFSNNSISSNSSNPNLTSTLIPSVSSINTLSKITKSPPPFKVVIGPSSGITAKVPLGVLDRARLVAVAAASGPDPRPKIDVAYIFAEDVKWQAANKKYKDSIKNNSNINY